MEVKNNSFNIPGSRLKALENFNSNLGTGDPQSIWGTGGSGEGVGVYFFPFWSQLCSSLSYPQWLLLVWESTPSLHSAYNFYEKWF